MRKNQLTQDEVNVFLEIKIDDNTTVRTALAKPFLIWVLKKIDNLPMFTPEVAELTAMSNSFPGQTMSDSNKIEILVKLKRLNLI